MIRLIDNLVELVGFIELIGSLPKGVCKTQDLVILNRSINLSTNVIILGSQPKFPT